MLVALVSHLDKPSISLMYAVIGMTFPVLVEYANKSCCNCAYSSGVTRNVNVFVSLIASPVLYSLIVLINDLNDLNDCATGSTVTHLFTLNR